MKKKVQELLDANIIRPSTSPYSSPALFVNKKGNEKKKLVDYPALNEITIKSNFPMPVVEEIIFLGECKYFSTLDLTAGYHKIPMDPESIKFTAFTTPEGHYEYLRVPFGLCTPPIVF